MALISNFFQGQRERLQLHDAIPATYYVQEHDGRILLQIDTTGRSDREKPGKISQTIQLDASSGRELLEILQRHFGDE